jgi:outer membrane protein assembly factor BamB
VTTVTSSNISQLALKWKQFLGGNISGSPAIVGGFLYIGTWNGTVFKLDAVTGAILAQQNLVPSSVCPTIKDVCRIGGSPTVSNGIVYIGASNAANPASIAATLYALNASDLSVAWSTPLSTQAGAEIWSSPVEFNGAVYLGLASHADTPCVKGAVYAVNESTHAIQWMFNTLDETSCPMGTNCVGAGVWSSAAIDATNGIVYFGTGNPGSTCQPSTPNATRYPDSIIALSATSGTLLSTFQAIANDTSDHDFGSSPFLTMTSSQAWVGESSKDGLMYFLPRGATGITGSPQSISIGGPLVASPAVQALASSSGTSNNIYQTTPRGKLVKINQSPAGSLRNVAEHAISSSRIFSSPMMVNDVILFGSDDFKLHAVSRFGKVLFSFATNGPLDSGPAESQGRIYFGSNDGNLYSLSIGAK